MPEREDTLSGLHSILYSDSWSDCDPPCGTVHIYKCVQSETSLEQDQFRLRQGAGWPDEDVSASHPLHG